MPEDDKRGSDTAEIAGKGRMRGCSEGDREDHGAAVVGVGRELMKVFLGVGVEDGENSWWFMASSSIVFW